jgi:hypothetical protein
MAGVVHVVIVSRSEALPGKSSLHAPEVGHTKYNIRSHVEVCTRHASIVCPIPHMHRAARHTPLAFGDLLGADRPRVTGRRP